MSSWFSGWFVGSSAASVESLQSFQSLVPKEQIQLDEIDINNFQTKKWLIQVTTTEDVKPLMSDAVVFCNLDQISLGKMISFENKNLVVIVCKSVNEEDADLPTVDRVSDLIVKKYAPLIETNNYKLIVTGYKAGGSVACEVAYKLKKQYSEKDISILTMNCQPYATVEKRQEMKSLFTTAKNLINIKQLSLLCRGDKVVPISSPFDFQDETISQFLGKIWELVSEVYLLKTLSYEKLMLIASVIFPAILTKNYKFTLKSLLVTVVAGTAYFAVTQIISLFKEKDSFRYNFDGYLHSFVNFLIDSTKVIGDTISFTWKLLWSILTGLLGTLLSTIGESINALYEKIKNLIFGNSAVEPIPMKNVDNEVDYTFLADLFKDVKMI